MPMWRRIFKVRQGKSSLLSFWQSIFFPKKTSSDSDAGRGTSDVGRGFRSARRRYTLATIIVVGVCILFIALPSHAEANAINTTVNWIVAIFTKILVYIAELLAYILLQLLDFLIQIVQFNNFVRAAPVRIGWPLIRDTVNMFFIVVVLVSAFATIIGYPKDFHYRQILPKLLIMAILINFSKTLIGLMIDFSQVLVLTFVNGFKDAAGGNFINALHIREAMSIESKAGSVISDDGKGNIVVNADQSTGVATYQIFNMMLAAIFAIWILSLSITLVLIMVIFFLVRIIILWFLLITSPVMFFAWSLPGKLQKSFSAFTDQWWTRLSTALIGGPTMAFFLWLSLAMAQGSNGPDRLTGDGESSLYKGPSQEATDAGKSLTSSLGSVSGSIVVTEIGKSENISNFIIMVAFMLLGVQVAVQSSSALAPKIGSLAGAIAGTGGALGFGVAGVVAASKVAERGVRGGAGWAGGAVDQRLGVKSWGARKAMEILPPSVMTQGMRSSLARTATEHQRAAKKRSEELKSDFGSLAPSVQMKELESLAGSTLATKADKIAAIRNMTSLATSTAYMKDQQNSEKEDILQRRFNGRKYEQLSAPEKLEVDSEARQIVDSRIAQKLKDGNDFAVSNNMTDLIDEIKKVREENPGLYSEMKDVSSVAGKQASDPESERKLKDDAFMNMGYTLNYLRGRGFMNDNGDLTVDPAYDKDFQRLARGRQGQLIASTLDYIQNSEDGRRQARVLLSGTATEADRNSANVRINAGSDGRNYTITAPLTGRGGAQVQSFAMGGISSDPNQIIAGVSQGQAQQLTTALQSYGGRNVSSVGRRLGTDTRAQELTTRLNAINTAGAAMPAARDEMSEILQKGLMDARGLFGVDANGSFTATGNISAAQNAGNYQAVVSDAYENLRNGTNSEINIRTIANSLANATGETLSRHGQALRNMPNNQGYEALRKAMDQASGEQARLFRDGLRTIMNEASVALREQAAGNQLNPVQQAHVETAQWLKGAQATTNEDKATARRVRSFLHGTDTTGIV